MKKLIFLLVVLTAFGFQSAYAQDVVDEHQPLKVKPTVALHGRVQYDYEFLNQDSGVDSVDDLKLRGNEFRRVYLSGSGKIYKNIKYKVQFEFAGSQIGYRDVYIKFVNLPGIGGNFTVGSFAEATGLDMLTSSNYIPMLERALMTSTQNFRWNSGLMYDNMGMFGGKLGLQMSYAGNGSHHGGFKDKHLENGGHFVARLTSPVYENKEKHQLVHIGVNFESRKRSKDPAAYSLKLRAEDHLGDYIHIPGEEFIDIPGLLKNQQDIGFEFAANFGSFSFQSEYEIAGYNAVVKDGSVDKDQTFNLNGFYALVSYFVTGGQRGFKHGAFARPHIYNNFCIKDGNWGELELVARYSTLDYSSITDYLDLFSGKDYYSKTADIGFGFNWYLNNHTRLMYNHIITSTNRNTDVDKEKNLNADLIRLQVDF
ncbi:MAG TPA: hypothetical protein ENK85_11495 [Saprospiraceae bacterium]|nr:hypothetical protein [Saprospiraceae bacterium]